MSVNITVEEKCRVIQVMKDKGCVNKVRGGFREDRGGRGPS